jgi:transcription initiation factor TFIIIB Brf1 subunit/transcription initiation factor TFIIB
MSSLPQQPQKKKTINSSSSSSPLLGPPSRLPAAAAAAASIGENSNTTWKRTSNSQSRSAVNYGASRRADAKPPPPAASSSDYYGGRGRGGGASSSDLETCKLCQSQDVYTDWAAGDIVCGNCGYVLAESIVDEGPEYNTYNNDSNADPAASLAKQRTAGPTRPDGTLEPTCWSASCFGGGGGKGNKNNETLRRKLVRIQRVRDYQLLQQQQKLYQDTTIDLAVRKRKLAEWINQGTSGNSSRSNSDHDEDGDGNNNDDFDDLDDEDDQRSYHDPDDTTATPPPRNMVLIEEHLEAQIEREQAQLDERKRQMNIRKWTLRRTAAAADDEPYPSDLDDDGTDDDEDHDGGPRKNKKRQKGKPKKRRTKKEQADFERAQEALAKAVVVLRHLARKHGLAPSLVDETRQRYQWYGATNDKLPNAACAAILNGTTGKYYLDGYETNRPAVRKLVKQIAIQFPSWNTGGTTSTSTTTATANSTTGTGTTATAPLTAKTTTTTAGAVANAEAIILAVLDRLKRPAGAAADQTLRDATLAVLRGDDSLTTPPPPATILAAVYFCGMVSHKLSQLGLTTTGPASTMAQHLLSVAQLAKQAAVPASRIRAAYASANRDVWLDRVATNALPQALLVRQLLPTKAV